MMEYRNFFRWLEKHYAIKITKKLQNTLLEHFGDNLNIYTEQDLFEQARPKIYTFKDNCINQKYYRYRKYL